MSPKPDISLPRPAHPVTVYIGLGSNLGDRFGMISEAVKQLRQLPATAMTALSPLYFTDPVELEGGEFLNGVAQLQTTLSPAELHQALEHIELALGRTGKGQRQSRTIDLDLLLYDSLVIDESTLSIPHPRMTERGFVLGPLYDLAPGLIIPLTGKTVGKLWEQCGGKNGLRPAKEEYAVRPYIAESNKRINHE